MAGNIDASELERGQQLLAIVVQTGGRVGDFPAQRFELQRVVAEDVRLETANCQLGAFPAAAQLAQANQASVGEHLDDGAHKASPVHTVGVPQRRLEWNADGRGAKSADPSGCAHRVLESTTYADYLGHARAEAAARVGRAGQRRGRGSRRPAQPG